MEGELSSLIAQNKNMIYKIAHYLDNGSNIEDLFQVGCIGMIKAYEKYDPSIGTKFSSFAYFYIMGEMKQYLRENKNIKIINSWTGNRVWLFLRFIYVKNKEGYNEY